MVDFMTHLAVFVLFVLCSSFFQGDYVGELRSTFWANEDYTTFATVSITQSNGVTTGVVNLNGFSGTFTFFCQRLNVDGTRIDAVDATGKVFRMGMALDDRGRLEFAAKPNSCNFVSTIDTGLFGILEKIVPCNNVAIASPTACPAGLSGTWQGYQANDQTGLPDPSIPITVTFSGSTLTLVGVSGPTSFIGTFTCGPTVANLTQVDVVFSAPPSFSQPAPYGPLKTYGAVLLGNVGLKMAFVKPGSCFRANITAPAPDQAVFLLQQTIPGKVVVTVNVTVTVVKLRFNLDYVSYTASPTQQNTIKAALAQFLGITVDELIILGVDPGSLVMRFVVVPLNSNSGSSISTATQDALNKIQTGLNNGQLQTALPTAPPESVSSTTEQVTVVTQVDASAAAGLAPLMSLIALLAAAVLFVLEH